MAVRVPGIATATEGRPRTVSCESTEAAPMRTSTTMSLEALSGASIRPCLRQAARMALTA